MYRQPELIAWICRTLHKHVRHAKKGKKTSAAYSVLNISPKVGFITTFNIKTINEKGSRPLIANRKDLVKQLEFNPFS